MAETDPPPRNVLIGQLFYLLTARFEDAAAAAGKGQSARMDQADTLDLASRLHATGQEVMILADAIIALSDLSGPEAL